MSEGLTKTWPLSWILKELGQWKGMRRGSQGKWMFGQTQPSWAVAEDPVATELTEPREVRAEGGNTDPQAVTLFEKILSESLENTSRTLRTTWKMGLEAHSTFPPNPWTSDSPRMDYAESKWGVPWTSWENPSDSCSSNAFCPRSFGSVIANKAEVRVHPFLCGAI